MIKNHGIVSYFFLYFVNRCVLGHFSIAVSRPKLSKVKNTLAVANTQNEHTKSRLQGRLQSADR